TMGAMDSRRRRLPRHARAADRVRVGATLMTAFDHVIVLLSFVYALALTHLLSRIGGLIANSQRVTWSWLLGLAIANALLNLLINWLALLGFRDQTSWTALDVA